MNVFNQNVPFPVYKTFDELVRKSRLYGKAGTISLSTDWATLEISATFWPLDRQSEPSELGRAMTAERLFAQAYSFLASSSARQERPGSP
jgi:hypothetical protein